MESLLHYSPDKVFAFLFIVAMLICTIVLTIRIIKLKKTKQPKIKPCWHWIYNTMCDYCRQQKSN